MVLRAEPIRLQTDRKGHAGENESLSHDGKRAGPSVCWSWDYGRLSLNSGAAFFGGGEATQPSV